MSRPMDVTSDERRMIEENRAQAAIEARPPDTTQVILRLMRIIHDAALAGRAIDPNDLLWEKVFNIVPPSCLD